MLRKPTGRFLGLLGILGLGCQDPAAVVQPMPFNHQIHKKNDVACVDCHQGVRDQPQAGIPRVSVCMECHETDIGERPEAKPYIDMVRRYAKEGREIPWVKLYDLPAHVYYSHRRHAGIAAIKCSQCHGDIGERETPAARAIARTLDMDTCMDCHEERSVENDCAWCHR